MNGLIRDGEFLRFKLPVLTFGSGEAADVMVPEAALLHCLVAPTPMGPALRAFETTNVNGVPTMAALLKDGDTLFFGGSTFTISWKETIKPESELLLDRQAQIETLLEQLNEERNNFREEQATAKEKLAAIDARYQEANELREKTRAAAAKYLKQQRAAIHAERATQLDFSAEYEFQKQHLDQAMRMLADDQERLRQEAESNNLRMASAWESMTATQNQLATERQEAETQFHLHLQILESQKEELSRRETALGAGEKLATEKLANLHAEIAGLEQRATHARMLLADLERQRAQKTHVAEPESVKVSDWNDPVPLTVRHDPRSADQLMMQLRQQEAEVARERQRLAVQLQHAATEREQLNDQRLLVTEQVRQLETTRRQWQLTETQTLAEMETLARKLAQREAELELRAKALSQAEVERKHREDQLIESRKSVEAWQEALTQQESRFAVERHRVEQELTSRRETVIRRESEVSQFFSRWDHRYAEACAVIHAEVNHIEDVRKLFIETAADCAKARDAALADVQKLTAKNLAVDEAKAILVKEKGPQAKRLLRAGRRRWEKRLETQVRGIADQRTVFETTLANTGERLLRMQQAFAKIVDQRASQLAFERGHDLARLREPVILSFMEVKAKQEEIIALQRAA